MTTVQQDADVVVRIEPWDGAGYAKIRITPGYRQQLLGLLREADIGNSTAMEFSAGSDVMELISVAVGTPQAWVAMGGVVTAFIGRNVHKRVRVEITGDRTFIEQRGYPKSDAVLPLIREAEKRHGRSEAEWQEMLRHASKPSSPEQLPDAQRQAETEQVARRAEAEAEAERNVRDDYDYDHRGPNIDHGPSLGR
jgi:hypothetical protein